MRSHTSRSRAWFLRIQDSNAAPVRNVFFDAATTEAMMRLTTEEKADGSFVYTPAKHLAVPTPLHTRSRVSTLPSGTATIVVR